MNYLERIVEKIKEEIPVEDLPDQNADALLMSYALLVEAKGMSVTNEDVHDAWAAWMTKIDPSHTSLVPYEQLDDETKEEDSVFTRALHRVAAEQKPS